MSSIREHKDASANEEEWERVQDGDRASPLSDVMVTCADPGTRPVSANTSVMAAAALLEYASGARTDNDRESAQGGRGSAGQTEAIELGDRGRLQLYNTSLILQHMISKIMITTMVKIMVWTSYYRGVSTVLAQILFVFNSKISILTNTACRLSRFKK